VKFSLFNFIVPLIYKARDLNKSSSKLSYQYQYKVIINMFQENVNK